MPLTIESVQTVATENNISIKKGMLQRYITNLIEFPLDDESEIEAITTPEDSRSYTSSFEAALTYAQFATPEQLDVLKGEFLDYISQLYWQFAIKMEGFISNRALFADITESIISPERIKEKDCLLANLENADSKLASKTILQLTGHFDILNDSEKDSITEFARRKGMGSIFWNDNTHESEIVTFNITGSDYDFFNYGRHNKNQVFFDESFPYESINIYITHLNIEDVNEINRKIIDKYVLPKWKFAINKMIGYAKILGIYAEEK